MERDLGPAVGSSVAERPTSDTRPEPARLFEPLLKDGDVRTLVALGSVAGKVRATGNRETLPMTSGNVPVMPTQSVQITARPMRGPFRPERLFISGVAADWIINDIVIGNQSQFAQTGDIPGEMFAVSAIDTFAVFDTVQTTMDIRLVATYIGSNQAGEMFRGAFIGTSGDRAPTLTLHFDDKTYVIIGDDVTIAEAVPVEDELDYYEHPIVVGLRVASTDSDGEVALIFTEERTDEEILRLLTNGQRLRWRVKGEKDPWAPGADAKALMGAWQQIVGTAAMPETDLPMVQPPLDLAGRDLMNAWQQIVGASTDPHPPKTRRRRR